MQIKGLHRNAYRFYRYARTQECLDAYRARYEEGVRLWETLKAEGIGDAVCASLCGFSRATYFRRKRRLDELRRGLTPPSKARRRRNRPGWGEAERQLVLAIRRANPTYGKHKIAVIIARDHGRALSGGS